MITLNFPPRFLTKVPNLWLVMFSNTLEFFDFFLYIHLATVLHQIFFPYGSLFISETFSLMNLYLLAPILTIGFALYGDNRGRKPIVIGCAVLMAISTALIALLPSYSQVGILATGCFIFLRLIQGFALAGEPFAAGLYVIESVSIKKCPFYISLLCATENIGSLFALLFTFITLHYHLSWRIPFIGAFIIVFFSLILRYYLEETPDYQKNTDLRTRISTYNIEQIKNFYGRLPFKHINTICVGLVNFGYPIAFVTSYIYLGKHLNEFYGYTLEDVVLHNVLVVCCEMSLSVTMGYLVSQSSIMPYKIQVARMIFAIGAALMMPYVLTHYHHVELVLVFQVIFVSCMSTNLIIGSVFKVLPVIGRFSLAAFGALGNRIINFFLMTFVLHYMVEQYGLGGNVIMILFGCSLVFLGIYLYHPYSEKEFENNYTPIRPEYC